MSNSELYIGVMSGTSLDGVDVVLTQIHDNHIDLMYADCYPMPSELKQAVTNINNHHSLTLRDIGILDHQLGQLFADAVLYLLDKYHIDPKNIVAIGNHGQTVFHQPDGACPFTMQLGDANIIAIRTGITVVADFRRKDMALGGQGAPLVPAFHKAIFQPDNSTLVVLNIGGIANISVMQPGHSVCGYDTGPGNGLLDAWCHHVTGHAYDKDGQLASQGQSCAELLTRFMNDDYFHRPAPKSTGREYFNLAWLTEHLSRYGHPLSDADVQATLLSLTTASIAQEVRRFRSGPQPELLVCGGGAKNPQLMQVLTTALPEWTVSDTDSQGISSDYMEAMAFAWLAYCRHHNLPSNLPDVTGAKRPTSLGIIYHAD